MFDSTIITGQYVRISLTPANLGERLVARMIDYIIMGLYAWGMFYVLLFLLDGFREEWLIYIVFFIFYFPILTYSLLFEVFNQGQSPGKKIMKIKVVMKDGTTPTLGSYLLRWLLLPVDITFTSGLGMIFILVTKNKQRIGDLAAGTMVMRLDNYKKIHVSLDEYKHLTEGYIPVYPQAADLSFEQFNVIRRVLDADKSNNNYIFQLSGKLKTMMNVSTSSDDRTFLETVVRDYEYYAYVEI